MVKPNHGSIRAAVEEAEAERKNLLDELKRLDQIKQRIAHLDVFIKRGKILLGDNPEHDEIVEQSTNNPPVVSSTINPAKTVDDRPLHHKIFDIIKESGKSWRISELVAEFRRREWTLSEKNANQVLRNTLKLKSNLFEKDDAGFYSIKMPRLPLSNKKGSETDLDGAVSEP